MTITSDWQTTTPLEAGCNALSWARQAQLIHEQERRATSPDVAAHRIPGTERASHGPRVPARLSPPLLGSEPLGPLAGDGWAARVAREPGRIPVVVLVPFRDLPVGGWAGYGARGVWSPESQPTEPLLYPSAFDVALVTDESFDNNTPPPAGRPFSVGLISKPETAPPTPRGTESLTVATHTAKELGRYLTEYAAISPVGEKRRYQAEADAYADFARACESAIARTLAWLPAVEAALEPIPPFAPIAIPAQLRGYIAVGPY